MNAKPEIAKQWHPTKNNGITPNDIAGESNKKVWWLCKNNHEEEEQIRYRVRRNGCKECKKLKL